jgi:hypothetical protein
MRIIARVDDWMVGWISRSEPEAAPTLQSTSDNNDHGRVLKFHRLVKRFPDTFVDVVIFVEESLLQSENSNQNNWPFSTETVNLSLKLNDFCDQRVCILVIVFKLWLDEKSYPAITGH